MCIKDQVYLSVRATTRHGNKTKIFRYFLIILITLSQFTDDSSRIPNSERIRWNRLRYDGASSNHATVADCYISKDDCSSSNPDLVPNSYGFTAFQKLDMTSFRIQRMLRCVQVNTWSKQAVVTNLYAAATHTRDEPKSMVSWVCSGAISTRGCASRTSPKTRSQNLRKSFCPRTCSCHSRLEAVVR